MHPFEKESRKKSFCACHSKHQDETMLGPPAHANAVDTDVYLLVVLPRGVRSRTRTSVCRKHIMFLAPSDNFRKGVWVPAEPLANTLCMMNALRETRPSVSIGGGSEQTVLTHVSVSGVSCSPVERPGAITSVNRDSSGCSYSCLLCMHQVLFEANERSHGPAFTFCMAEHQQHHEC